MEMVKQPWQGLSFWWCPWPARTKRKAGDSTHQHDHIMVLP
jgi:hypothetical protein